MSEIDALINSLKRQLKIQGKTYRDVAEQLSLAESSVKRIFTGGDLSLKRLQQLCHWLGISVAMLANDAEQQQPQLAQLTVEQEQQLVDDTALLLIVTCVMNQWRFNEIVEYYSFSEPQCIALLAQLDRMGLIELQPGNRIKLRIAPNFRWHSNGPIQQFFQRSVANEFFRSDFTGEEEQLIVLNGTLSDESNQLFQERMGRLAAEFNDCSQTDLKQPLEQRHGTTAVIAVRRWSLSMFDQFKR